MVRRVPAAPPTGEWRVDTPGLALRDWGGRLPVALVFPERQEHALSTLGWQVVYRLFAARDDVVVERFFFDPDSPKPRSIDSGCDLGLFPLVLFSLNFEGDFPAVLTLLRTADIPLSAAERPDWPLVLAGGPITFLNPFPLLPALDGIFVGEAEVGLDALISALAQAWIHGQDKSQALESVAALPGVLIPGKSQQSVRRQVAASSGPELRDPGFSCFVSSQAQFQDMFLLEVNRGCPAGCRFCAAGSIYKPARHARLETLQAIVSEYTPRKVGLVGTALTDWPDLLPFLQWLRERDIKFALSSLRASGLTDELLTFLRHAGVRSLTLAVEGASSRLRTAMNKHFSEDIFLDAVARISRLRFNTLKLYLITGWPGENEDDWAEFEILLERVQAARLAGQGERRNGLEVILLSVSCLVPKAQTPLQWAEAHDEAWLKTAMRRLKASVARHRGMRFVGENPSQARQQMFLARGGTEIFPFLCRASKVGMAAAFREQADLVHEVLARPVNADTVFAWDQLDIGISKKFLYSEWIKYQHALTTPPCPPEGCASCGLCGMQTFLGWNLNP